MTFKLSRLNRNVSLPVRSYDNTSIIILVKIEVSEVTDLKELCHLPDWLVSFNYSKASR